MKPRYVLVGIAALAAMAMPLSACSDEVRMESAAPVTPTSSIGQPANTLQDALNQARDYLEAGPPYVVLDEVGPVVYVETTYGQVLTLSRFNALPPGLPDSLPVWVIVAYGHFQDKSFPGSTTPGEAYSVRYMVIPKGQVGLSSGASNEQYDLSRLGTVVQVPVPLPPFPTPVELRLK